MQARCSIIIVSASRQNIVIWRVAPIYHRGIEVEKLLAIFLDMSKEIEKVDA